MVMTKKLLISLALILPAAVSIPRLAAQAGPLGLTVTPSVPACVNDDSDITCENRIVITAGVSYGITATLQTAYIDMVTTKGGGQGTVLEDPINFEISKSEPIFVYALRPIDLVGYPHPTAPFQSYTIDPPRQSYTVTVTVTLGTQLLSTYTLSPDTPVYLDKTSSHQVTASLAGKQVSYTGAPEFSSYILFNWNNNFLLVPRAALPANTSMTFANSVASLLQRLLAQDQALLAGNPNADAAYLVSGMKTFRGAPLPGSGNLALTVMNPAVAITNISLEMDNAQVSPIVNEAVGWIKTAALAPFTSMQTGTMDVQVENVGSTPTHYIVTMTDCQPGINPVAAQAQTLNPRDIKDFYFDVTTNVNMSGTHYCWVTLGAPSGRVYDSVQVYFDTKSGIY